MLISQTNVKQAAIVAVAIYGSTIVAAKINEHFQGDDIVVAEGNNSKDGKPWLDASTRYTVIRYASAIGLFFVGRAVLKV